MIFGDDGCVTHERNIIPFTQISIIVNEVLGTIFFIYKDILLKKTHKLCLNILIRLKSIIKHTSNFHSDITPRSIIKHTSNFHSDITSRSIKNKQLFIQRQLAQDVMNNFSLRYMLKKDVMNNFSHRYMLKKDSWYKMQ